MTARSPSALLVSAALHALVLALVLLLTYVVQSHVRNEPKVLELVAGEGDNYGATVAPALGTSGGIKLAIPLPEAPAAKPAAPEPAVTKAPMEKPVAETPAKPVDLTTPNFSKQIRRKVANAENKAKTEIKKEREAEQKRLTKEQFDKQNKASKAPPATGGNPKVTHIDSEGIASGVVGGSTANTTGGANGRALAREEGDVLDAYFSLLKQKLKEALEKPPGLSDTLTAVAEFRVNADGSLSDARVSRSSGSDEFDRAVLDDIARFRSFGPRPDGKSETVSLTFRMKEEDDG